MLICISNPSFHIKYFVETKFAAHAQETWSIWEHIQIPNSFQTFTLAKVTKVSSGKFANV